MNAKLAQTFTYRPDISEQTHLHFIHLHDDLGFRPNVPQTTQPISIRAFPFLVGIFVDAVYRVRHTIYCILQDTDSNYIQVSEKQNSEQTGARARNTPFGYWREAPICSSSAPRACQQPLALPDTFLLVSE